MASHGFNVCLLYDERVLNPISFLPFSFSRIFFLALHTMGTFCNYVIPFTYKLIAWKCIHMGWSMIWHEEMATSIRLNPTGNGPLNIISNRLQIREYTSIYITWFHHSFHRPISIGDFVFNDQSIELFIFTALVLSHSYEPMFAASETWVKNCI